MSSLNIIPYSGLNFWTFFLVFIVVHRMVLERAKRPAFRNLFMILVSLVVIGSSLKSTFLILFLVFLTVFIYIIGKFILIFSPNKTIALIDITVITIVVILCYFKYNYIQTAMNLFWDRLANGSRNFAHASPHLFFVGISYFSFKFIHFLIDIYKKKTERLNILTFINYIFFFPGFFSGPINRFDLFAKNIHDIEEIEFSSEKMEGFKRIINGLFKKIVLADSLRPYSIAEFNFVDLTITPLMAILAVYAYMFYIYFDFAGYTDMAIGGARLVGIELPENFNYPFLKRNLQQFWANWHMSLTAWLTDYIYWPLVRKIRKYKTLRKNPVTVSNICIIITFIICGIWHGDGFNFFIWGLFHGIGLAILNMYTYIERKYFPKNIIKFINRSQTGYILSTFITFQYVAFGFLLFGCNMKQLRAYLGIFLK